MELEVNSIPPPVVTDMQVVKKPSCDISTYATVINKAHLRGGDGKMTKDSIQCLRDLVTANIPKWKKAVGISIDGTTFEGSMWDADGNILSDLSIGPNQIAVIVLALPGQVGFDLCEMPFHAASIQKAAAVIVNTTHARVSFKFSGKRSVQFGFGCKYYNPAQAVEQITLNFNAVRETHTQQVINDGKRNKVSIDCSLNVVFYSFIFKFISSLLEQ